MGSPMFVVKNPWWLWLLSRNCGKEWCICMKILDKYSCGKIASLCKMLYRRFATYCSKACMGFNTHTGGRMSPIVQLWHRSDSPFHPSWWEWILFSSFAKNNFQYFSFAFLTFSEHLVRWHFAAVYSPLGTTHLRSSFYLCVENIVLIAL